MTKTTVARGQNHSCSFVLQLLLQELGFGENGGRRRTGNALPISACDPATACVGFGVQGSGFRVQGLGFGMKGLGVRE